MVTAVRVGAFTADAAVADKIAARVFIAEKGAFAESSALVQAFGVDTGLVEPLTLKEGGANNVTTWKKNQQGTLVQFVIAQFVNKRSRNMGIIRGDTLFETVGRTVPTTGDALVIVAVDTSAHAASAALAVAKHWPLYNRKTATGKSNDADRTVYIDFLVKDGGKVNYEQIDNLVNAMRTTQRLVDMPCSELNTSAFVKEAHDLVKRLNSVKDREADVKIEVIEGEDLHKKGFGGLWGVGKAAEHLPALVHLSYKPTTQGNEATIKTIAMVGKGIVYDSGGLSLKQTAFMCGMKGDMGGAAAVFGAFEAAVLNHVPGVHLHGVLCLAENAIDAKSYKNDDVLHMYSGKTVEVNNTDAEGRLVVADGVSYASKHLNPSIIVDIATLTGAQMMTTGLKHAAILTNCEMTERIAVVAGKQSGDLVFPILYAPEILKQEFESAVADMKNSVKSRLNAQSSCAGHFIQDHLHVDYKNPWLHIDIAGPATCKDRATGFGVGLLYEFIKTF